MIPNAMTITSALLTSALAGFAKTNHCQTAHLVPMAFIATDWKLARTENVCPDQEFYAMTAKFARPTLAMKRKKLAFTILWLFPARKACPAAPLVLMGKTMIATVWSICKILIAKDARTIPIAMITILALPMSATRKKFARTTESQITHCAMTACIATVRKLAIRAFAPPALRRSAMTTILARPMSVMNRPRGARIHCCKDAKHVSFLRIATMAILVRLILALRANVSTP